MDDTNVGAERSLHWVGDDLTEDLSGGPSSPERRSALGAIAASILGLGVLAVVGGTVYARSQLQGSGNKPSSSANITPKGLEGVIEATYSFDATRVDGPDALQGPFVFGVIYLVKGNTGERQFIWYPFSDKTTEQARYLLGDIPRHSRIVAQYLPLDASPLGANYLLGMGIGMPQILP